MKKLIVTVAAALVLNAAPANAQDIIGESIRFNYGASRIQETKTLYRSWLSLTYSSDKVKRIWIVQAKRPGNRWNSIDKFAIKDTRHLVYVEIPKKYSYIRVFIPKRIIGNTTYTKVISDVAKFVQ